MEEKIGKKFSWDDIAEEEPVSVRNALIDELVDKFENIEFQHIGHQCITVKRVINILKRKKK